MSSISTQLGTFARGRFATGAIALVPIAALITFGWTASASAYSLGGASDYNVFVLGDYDMFSTDVEGKLAVGGSLTADTFGIGSKLRGDRHATTLAVGGDVTLSNGKVYGDAVYGGSAVVANNVGFEFLNDDDSPIRRATISQGSPIDFSVVGSELKSLAKTISSDAASYTSGVLTERYGDVALTTLSGTDSDLNIFNLTGDLFANLRKLTFDVPDTSKIVVNVSGTAATVSDFGFYFGDRDCNAEGIHMDCRDRSRDILFNFAETELLEVTRVGFMGTILAPHAAVDFNNGHINGTLVAGSLSGTGESHLYTYNGDEPESSTEVPEPGLLLGLAALVGLGSRYRQPKIAATVEV
ncbi:MAG: choice-of-anchor A family protein [Cyanobacteria bacterium J06628_6]